MLPDKLRLSAHQLPEFVPTLPLTNSCDFNACKGFLRPRFLLSGVQGLTFNHTELPFAACPWNLVLPSTLRGLPCNSFISFSLFGGNIDSFAFVLFRMSFSSFSSLYLFYTLFIFLLSILRFLILFYQTRVTSSLLATAQLLAFRLFDFFSSLEVILCHSYLVCSGVSFIYFNSSLFKFLFPWYSSIFPGSLSRRARECSFR